MTILSKIRANRKELRLRGVTPTEILMLEALGYKAPSGFVRLTVAALGRMVGISRQCAHRHIVRLEALGIIVRLGSAIMLNVRTVLKWVADAVKNRAAHLKRLFHKRKSQSVTPPVTHRELDIRPTKSAAGNAACLDRNEYGDRLDNLEWLRKNYIPPHMRKSTTFSA